MHLDDFQSAGSPLNNAIASYLQKENFQKDAKEDADELFCRSLIPILPSLPPKKIGKQSLRCKNYCLTLNLTMKLIEQNCNHQMALTECSSSSFSNSNCLKYYNMLKHNECLLFCVC